MMTPEEIQQVVEDYRKSNSLNEEIFSKEVQNFFRNLGRQKKDKVNVEKEKNGNGAQGATNGAQGSQSSTNGAQGSQSSTTGSQGAQSNDNVGAQGNGAQSSTTGSQGAQGGQGPQNNTVKKNEIDLDAISQYSRKGKEVTINDFGGIKPSGAQGVQTKEVKPKISPATFSTNQKQSRELVSTGKLKDTDLNKYSRSNTYTADDGKTQVNRSTVNTIAQFDMGPSIKKGDKLGVISKNLRKKYDLQVANMNNKVEAYDLVLDYVLSEGHADNIEEAHYVMMQMDEETIQTITEIKKRLIGGALLATPFVLGQIEKRFNPIKDKRNEFQIKKQIKYEKNSNTTQDDGYFYDPTVDRKP